MTEAEGMEIREIHGAEVGELASRTYFVNTGEASNLSEVN